MKYVLTFCLTILLGLCGHSFQVEAQPFARAWPAWVEEEEPRPFAEMSGGNIFRMWLVAGQVTDVRDTPEETVVTVAIEEVYAGPAVLEKRSFQARFSKDFSHAQFYRLDYLKAFANGQRLLMAVEWLKDAKLPAGGRLDYSRAYGFPLPTILDGTPQTLELVEHAQRVRAVYQAPAAKRVEMMKQYAFGNLPFTTLWAIRSIGSWRNQQSVEILRQLAVEKDRTLLQLVEVEKALVVGWNVDDWLKSDERLALLHRIVTAEQGSRSNFVSINAMGPVIYGLSSYNSAQIVGLLKAFVANKTVAEQWRTWAVGYVRKNTVPNGKISEEDARGFKEFAEKLGK